MKTIIILEGLPTSGKSCVCEQLIKSFSNNINNCFLIDEEKSTKALHNPKEKNIPNSIEYMKELLNQIEQCKENIIIIDRFILTYIASHGSSTANFKKIENILLAHKTYLIYLEYDKNSLIDRINNALSKRKGHNLKNHLDSITQNARDEKQKMAQMYEYYHTRGVRLENGFQDSILNKLKIDVTNITNPNDYNIIYPEILKFINN